MFVRQPKHQDFLVGNTPAAERAGMANLYPTAFPFDRANHGKPTSMPCVALHGSAAGVTSQVDLWSGAITRTLPAAGFTVGVSSSSASDTAAGTGARTIEVDIIDTSYIPHTLTLTLSGQTKVSDTSYVGTAFRINDIRVITTGSGLANAGDLYVYDASDTVTAGVPQTSTKIFHKVLTGENVGRGLFYTVPAGCQMQLTHFRGGFNDLVNTNRSALLEVAIIALSGIKTTLPIAGQLQDGSGPHSVIPDFPIIVDEKSTVTVKVSASASATVMGFLDAVIFVKTN